VERTAALASTLNVRAEGDPDLGARAPVLQSGETLKLRLGLRINECGKRDEPGHRERRFVVHPFLHVSC
jgi:hypothetical protein